MVIRAAVAEGLLRWTPGDGLVAAASGAAGTSTGGRPTAGAAAKTGAAVGERLLVADSWLVRDGRVRGFERHRERFLRACGECGGPPLRRLVEFWQDMTAALPRSGEWFPRVELAAGSMELRLLLRHAPPLGSGVRVWAAGQSDPRTVPRRKGPGLDALARVRRRASDKGAEEAVLIAHSGVVLEAATASVLWWEDDTRVCPRHGCRCCPASPSDSSRNRPRAPGPASPTVSGPWPNWTGVRSGW